ncbi:MAG: hypothetical protein EKK56_10025 [Flavobacteriaceae bacterium]|nr:MAG: hypothetical protein EKK56_10025 [Flavobacteriaceae bacterium]
MKKLFLLLILSISTIGIAQKGKTKAKPPATKNVVLTKVDNISAEVISDKSGKRVVLFVKNEDKVDTLEVKKLEKTDFKPTGFVVKSFSTQGKKFYHVNWKTQKSSHIKETVFLDANKTASHDVEKNRNEGFEFMLNADGSFVLKTKTQNSTYVYNVATSKYEIKGASKASGTKKKK